MQRVIGSATLINDDCLRSMRELPDASVDLVLTDPPFSSGTRREAAKGLRKNSMIRSDARWFGSDAMTTSGFRHLMRECALEWHRLLKPGAHVLSFIDFRMEAVLADAIESADLRKAGRIVWDKTHFGMGRDFRHQHEGILHFTKGVGAEPLRRDVGDVISCAPIRGGDHPTQKPVELLKVLISVLCPPGGMILDPFFGSGSVAVAATEGGRRFVGSERDAGFFEAAVRRVSVSVRDRMWVA